MALDPSISQFQLRGVGSVEGILDAFIALGLWHVWDGGRVWQGEG